MSNFKKGLSGWGLLALFGVLVIAYFILCRLLEATGH
jgi:hypothetical protein